MFTVRVNGLRFHGFHGVYGHEKATGNEFVASIEAEVNGTADRTDRIEDTVDYSALSRVLLEVSDSQQFETVERLAAVFAEAALERFRSLQVVTVTLDKLNPPGMTSVASCGVRLTRRATAKPVN